MATNENNNLDLNSVFSDMHNKQNRMNSKQTEIDIPSNKSVEVPVKDKGKATQSVTFTIDKKHFELLKKSFQDDGLLSQSVGIRQVLVNYLKSKGLVE